MFKKLIAPVVVGGVLAGSLALGGVAGAATPTTTTTANAARLPSLPAIASKRHKPTNLTTASERFPLRQSARRRTTPMWKQRD